MPTVNVKKAYAEPSVRPRTSKLEITQEELENLVNLIGPYLADEEKDSIKTRLDFHVGPNSIYDLKSLVRQELKVIYERIKNLEITPSEKKIITYRLYERALNCTPGFHDGVNSITEGFYIARSVDDLLFRVRQDIVSRLANRLTDEVHANNRVFTVAAKLRYGVFPVNIKDKYLGSLDGEFISKQLEQTFAEEMNCCNVLQRLEEQLGGQLYNAGYEGEKIEGYDSDITKKMDKYFIALFSQHPVVKSYNHLLTQRNNEEAKKQKIQEHILKEIEDLLLKYPAEFPDIERHKRLRLSALTSPLINNIYKKWADAGVEKLPTEEKERLAKLQADFKQTTKPIQDPNFDNARDNFQNLFYSIDKNKNITNVNWPNVKDILWQEMKKQQYFNLSNEEERSFDILLGSNSTPEDKTKAFLALTEGMKNINDLIPLLNLNDVDMEAKLSRIHAFLEREANPYSSFVKIIKGITNTAFKKILINAYREEFKDKLINDLDLLVFAIKDMNLEEMILFLQSHSNVPWVKILDILIKNEQAIIPIFLQVIPDKERADILTKVDKDGYNALMLAAFSQPTAIAPILEGLKSQPEDVQRAVWMRVGNDGWNALRIAARYQPTAIRPLLEGLKSQPEDVQRAVWSQVSINGWNALMLAARYQPTAIRPLLDALKSQPEDVQRAVWTRVSNDGWNALMLAAFSQPTAIAPILDALKSQPEDVQRAVWTQVNKGGLNALMNALMHAARYQPAAIGPLLEGLKSQPEDVQRAVWTQVDKDGLNALILATRHQPNAIWPLLEGLKSLSKDIQRDVWAQVSVLGWNALMIAALYQPTAIGPLLEGLKSQPEDVQRDIWRQVTKGGWNALMLATRNEPTAIEPLLEGLKSQPEDVQRAVWTQVETNGNNSLMIAILHQPTAIKPLLQELKSQPEDVQRTVLTKMNKDGKNALMLAGQIHMIAHVLDILMLYDNSSVKCKMLIQKKHILTSNIKSKQLSLKTTLNCIGTMNLADQNKFYNAWMISNPKLKRYGVCELRIQEFIDKFKDDENDIKQQLQQALNAYRETERTSKDIANLWQILKEVLETPEALEAFKNNNKNIITSSYASVFYSSPETRYSRLINTTHRYLQALAPKETLSAITPKGKSSGPDNPSGPTFIITG